MYDYIYMDFFFLEIFFYRILDEHEMYVDEQPFKLSDYVLLTYFLNNILYKIIQENILGKNITYTNT